MVTTNDICKIIEFLVETKTLGLVRALQNTGGALSYIARRENWYATGNFGQERLRGSSAITRSDSESIFQQQFGEYHGDGGCYSVYILTAAQSSGPQDHYKRSRMTILGLAGVLLCENEQG